MRHSPERRPSPSRRSRSRMSQGGAPPPPPMQGPPPPNLVPPMHQGGPMPPQMQGMPPPPHQGGQMHFHPMHQMQMPMNMMMPGMPMETPSGHPGHPGRAEDPDDPTPICRCRVLYLGSAVPHVTKDGLQGIQEPLKELYPEDGAHGAKGIDSWLSVWSNGFLLENMDENRKKVSRFFPIEALHYCAAVRYVLVPGSVKDPTAVNGGGNSNTNTLNRSSTDKNSQSAQPRFLPLDSPFARNPNINHPPLFAAILRRTTGIKVLECHVFICKRETAANALVRCSFHAYADSTYAKHLENGASLYGTVGSPTPVPPMMPGGTFNPAGPEPTREFQQSVMEMSDDSINSVEQMAPNEWSKVLQNGNVSPQSAAPMRHEHVPNGTSSPNENGNGNAEEISVFNGDDNHKVWAGKEPDMPDGIYGDYGSTMRSFRSSASGLSTRNRPRQMMMQSPPPPPIPEEFVTKGEGREEKKEKKKKKKSRSRDLMDGGDLKPPLMNGNIGNGTGGMRGSGSVIDMATGRSGSVMGGRKMSAGSFMGINAPNGRPPVNGGGPQRGGPVPHGPPMMMPMPPQGPRGNKKAGTFSARGKGSRGAPPFMMYGPGMGPPPPHMMGPPPHLLPPPGHPLYAHHGPMPFQMGGGREGHMEEPIYMPHAARPLSPVASYQPGHFPHDAYYSQQQYATIDKNGRYRGERKHKSNGKSSKQQSSDSNAEDSEYGGPAGIYKKGHINERAFAHSMKNEHRSRSFGSLANLQFDPNGEVLGGMDGTDTDF